MTPETLDERRKASLQLDVLIRAGLVFALAALCYRIFSPFLTLMVWALILAVAIYPIHQALARRIGGRQGLAATIIAIVGGIFLDNLARWRDGRALRNVAHVETASA